MTSGPPCNRDTTSMFGDEFWSHQPTNTKKEMATATVRPDCVSHQDRQNAKTVVFKLKVHCRNSWRFCSRKVVNILVGYLTFWENVQLFLQGPKDLLLTWYSQTRWPVTTPFRDRAAGGSWPPELDLVGYGRVNHQAVCFFCWPWFKIGVTKSQMGLRISSNLIILITSCW